MHWQHNVLSYPYRNKVYPSKKRLTQVIDQLFGNLLIPLFQIRTQYFCITFKQI